MKLQRSGIAAVGAVLVLLVAACGGGADEPSAGPQRRAALRAPQVPDASALMDWAEGEYGVYFPGHQTNRFFDVYVYRAYDNGNYVGVAGQDVYIWGPVSGHSAAPLRVGALADFACRVVPGSCAAAVSALRGQTLYATALGSAGNACRDCHGDPPGAGIAAILNAAGPQDSQGEAAVIRAKIDSYFLMRQFAGVSDTDLADIAAYVNAVRWGKPLQ